jgi:hypothetical protein
MSVITTYQDGNRLEDVLRMVINISPTDTPFVSGISKSKANDVIHQWVEDSLEARGDNAQVDGGTTTFSASTAPKRVSNLTQILEKTFSVSSSERWVKGAGVSDMYLYQQQKKLKALANDLEHACLRGSLASGNDSTARRMAGALNFITTNATDYASGTLLVESIYNGLLELTWNAGGDVDEVYVGAKLKRAISEFTAGNTKNISADDKRLVRSIDVYDSDFGVQKIFKSRDMLSGTNACAIMMIENAKFALAVGEPIGKVPDEEVAQTIRGKQGILRGELTIEAKAQSASAVGRGFNNQ